MASETVAVLFTDLVGSTELLSRVGEERAEQLRREHFGILREAFSPRGGTEVKNLGDGLMIVFGAASTAVDAAVAMQQRLDLRNRTAEEQLVIRVGLSMGECAVENADYFGTAVVEAARLCAVANSRQILTTDIVRVLTGSRGDHAFEPLGPRELKGLDAPVAACEVRWEPIDRLDTAAVPVPIRLTRPSNSLFVGRESERETILDALKDAQAARRRRVVLIAGEPGIGKTTLVSEVAAALHAQGARVLYGRCDEDIVVPYQPWREAFSHLVEHAPSLLEETRARLDALLLESRTPTDKVSGDLESERYALYEIVVDALTRASLDAPVVLILDDLHWTDAPSAALLRYVAAAPAEMAVMILATFRDSEIGPTHPFGDTLAALHREDGVDRLRLHGLDDLDLLQMLERLAGHTMDDQGIALRDALVAETDGNPFFVGEILRHLSETGAIFQEGGRWVAGTDLRQRGLPVSVREVIGRRVARLGDDARKALACASVIGRDFSLPLLAAVLDRDENDVLDMIEPAVEASLVVEVGPNQFAFTHALVEHSLYDELSATRRARTHRLVGEAIEASVGEIPAEAVTELAHHWSEATTPQDTEKAINYARLAGDYALAQLAPDEAVRWYGRAMALLERDEAADRARRAVLMVGLGDAQRQMGDPAFQATLVVAGNLARVVDDTDLLVRAAIATNRGFASSIGHVATDVVALLHAAIDATANERSSRRAKLLGSLAAELVYADPEQASDIAGDAIQLALELDDDATLLWVTARAEIARRIPDTLAERRALADEVLAAAERLDDPVLRWYAASTFQTAGAEACDLALTDRLLATCEELAPRIGQPYMRWTTAFERVPRQIVAGEAGAAEASATEALEIGTASGQPDALLFYGAQLVLIRGMQGRLDEIIDLIADATSANPGVPALRALLAHAYVAIDRVADAGQVIEGDIENSFTSFPFDSTWTLSMTMLAETVAALELAAPAELLYTRIAPYAHLFTYSGVTVFDALEAALGRLAGALGRFDVADEHFARAHAIHESLPSPYFTARCDLAWARMLLRRGAAGDRTRARELIDAALALARRGDFAVVTQDGTKLLERIDRY